MNIRSIRNARVVIPSVEELYNDENSERLIPELSKIDEKTGKMKHQTDEDKMMHSVLEDDKKTISDGKLISEAMTQGIGSLTPDMILQNLVRDFKLARKLYGDTIIRELTGYSPNYIEKNITIPEFKRELGKKIEDRVKDLKDEGLMSKDGSITDKGITLSALVLYVEELDHLMPKGFGDKKSKKLSVYGDKEDYKNGITRYRDIAIKQTIKTALRRGHSEIDKLDIKSYERRTEGKISIIYGLDASGSMKGPKLKIAKKAGIALAFKAIADHNKVGLVVFGSDIKEAIAPTSDFMQILRSLAEIKASMETDIAKSITKSLELFDKGDTKHLILLTDALPTKGIVPEEATMHAVSEAKAQNITVSMVGINLDAKGLELARKIVEIGSGKLYGVTDLEELDKIILEDYDSLKSSD